MMFCEKCVFETGEHQCMIGLWEEELFKSFNDYFYNDPIFNMLGKT